MKRNFALIAPYAVWMVLMSILPSSAWAYAVRGLVTLLLLVYSYFCYRHCFCGGSEVQKSPSEGGAVFRGGSRGGAFLNVRPTLIGVLVGIIVFFVWIAPEALVVSSLSTSTSDLNLYVPATCGWALTLAKLFASAFVISVAEELFFRKFLVEFAGFGWMLFLFAIEHMRWDLGVDLGCIFIAEGAFAGLAYGILAKRCGLFSAIVAHAVTNLILGLYIIFFDKWFYWA